jgi:predicted CXXCH cytochrome family protein
MKVRTAAACMFLVAALSVGCSATTSHKVLSTFFDGVPEPGTGAQAAPGAPVAAGGAAPARQAGYREHGPYAAKLCKACHEAGATNALVVPKEQLCLQCHELRLDRKYVHGPLASGGCLVCHDPHSSQYRYLLVSESDGFCLHCHDGQALAKNASHAGVQGECTTCHDAHMSDRKFLLKP